jgi:hypothetical protein
MLVIKEEVSKSTGFGFICFGILIGCIPLFAGEMGPYTFFLVLGIGLIVLGMLLLFNRGNGFRLDDKGITDIKKKKTWLYSELGYYRHEIEKTMRMNTFHYIHIYDPQNKRLFTIDLPDTISHEPIVEYLSKYLKKYQWS